LLYAFSFTSTKTTAQGGFPMPFQNPFVFLVISLSLT